MNDRLNVFPNLIRWKSIVPEDLFVPFFPGFLEEEAGEESPGVITNIIVWDLSALIGNGVFYTASILFVLFKDVCSLVP